jgi:hypothetical protein
MPATHHQRPPQPMTLARRGAPALAAVSLAGGGGDPVEDDRKQHDGNARGEGRSDVQRGERRHHAAAEARCVDQCGDGHHGERGHDRLIHPEHDRALRHRQQHLAQRLSSGGAERAGRLEHRRLYRADAVVGEPDNGRQRIEQGGDRRGRRPDEEEQGERREVDKGRHGLQEVEDRGEQLVHAVADPAVHAERDADQQRDEHSRHGEGERVHGFLPQPQQPDGHQPEPGQHSHPGAAHQPRAVGGDRDDAEPADQWDRQPKRRLGEDRRDGVHQRVDHLPDDVEPVQEHGVGVTPCADRVVHAAQPPVQLGEVGLRERESGAPTQEREGDQPADQQHHHDGSAAR